MEKSEEKPQDLEEFLNQMGMGKWQMYQAFFLLFPAAYLMFPVTELVIPGSNGSKEMSVYNPDRLSELIPARQGMIDQFSRVVPFIMTDANNTGKSCPTSYLNAADTVACEAYAHKRTNTLEYYFGPNWKKGLVGMFCGFGLLLAVPLTGHLSDKFGRRFALLLSAVCVAIFIIMRSFAVNYEMFLGVHLVGSVSEGGLYTATFILAMEMVAPCLRIRVGFFSSVYISGGQVIGGFIAWSVPEWREIIRMIFIPQLLLIIYFCIMAESVRWLLSKEKYESAEKTLKQILKWNHINLPESIIVSIVREARRNNELRLRDKTTDQENIETDTALIALILKPPTMIKRMLTISVWWITQLLEYYGVSVSATDLAENMHFNNFLGGFVKIPGYLIGSLLSERLSRKLTLSRGCFLCAICCLLFPFIPNSQTWLSRIVFVVAKSSITMALQSCCLFAIEPLPTKHRCSLFAFVSIVGRIGSMAAPLTPALVIYWEGMSSIIFGGMTLLSRFLALTMPETVGLVLSNTMTEHENIGIANTCF